MGNVIFFKIWFKSIHGELIAPMKINKFSLRNTYYREILVLK